VHLLDPSRPLCIPSFLQPACTTSGIMPISSHAPEAGCAGTLSGAISPINNHSTLPLHTARTDTARLPDTSQSGNTGYRQQFLSPTPSPGKLVHVMKARYEVNIGTARTSEPRNARNQDDGRSTRPSLPHALAPRLSSSS